MTAAAKKPRAAPAVSPWVKLAETTNAKGQVNAISIRRTDGVIGHGCTGWKMRKKCGHVDDLWNAATRAMRPGSAFMEYPLNRIGNAGAPRNDGTTVDTIEWIVPWPRVVELIALLGAIEDEGSPGRAFLALAAVNAEAFAVHPLRPKFLAMLDELEAEGVRTRLATMAKGAP